MYCLRSAGVLLKPLRPISRYLIANGFKRR
jgi:hypothetical protein